jgi:hypothetical protein
MGYPYTSIREGQGLGPWVKGQIPRNGLCMVHMVGIHESLDLAESFSLYCAMSRVLLINILYPIFFTEKSYQYSLPNRTLINILYSIFFTEKSYQYSLPEWNIIVGFEQARPVIK